MESLKGHLLIAGAGLFDPNFRRTVILMAEHGEDGAFGLVLNQPSELTVAEAVPGLAAAVDADLPLFVGGPVMQQGVVVIADFGDPERVDLPITGSAGLVTGDLEDGAFAGAREIRVFAGHSGWGPGQLEDELTVGSWLTLPAVTGDAFADPADLWSDVVRRLGRDHVLLATLPVDPSLN